MPTPGEEAIAAAEAAALKATEEAEAEALKAEDEADAFDKDRALKTIRTQRAEEKRLKAELAEARKAEARLAAIEAAEAEAKKTASEKLTEKDAEVTDLRNQLHEVHVRHDFEKHAADMGVPEDAIDIVYLAAKEQGFLGAYDPKTGQVSAHALDKLAEKVPSLFGQKSGGTGEAGVRGGGRTTSVARQFDEAIRNSIRR